jgi:aminotransferase EvaB
MQVKYNYLDKEFADCEKIISEWKLLIKSTDFTLGAYIEEFENIFAKFVNVKHCIATNNGTDALILSLKALDIGIGDEVITVANTFYATVGAIVAVGATPVLIDSDERFQININEIEGAITKKTKAILPVHWAGGSPNMEKIIEIAKNNGLKIIEDACMGIGGYVGEKHTGTLGDVGAFSAHPLKSLNAMGDGGMVVTNDDNLAAWMRKYRNHGMVNRDSIEFWGVNYRMQPIQAIVLMNGLKKLKKSLKIRKKNADIYDKEFLSINEKIYIPKRVSENKETYALYMGLFEDRDNLIKFLTKNKIEVKIHYPIPLNKQKASQKKVNLSFSKFKNVNSQANKIMTIPVHQFLNEKQIYYTINKIKEFYKN